MATGQNTPVQGEERGNTGDKGRSGAARSTSTSGTETQKPETQSPGRTIESPGQPGLEKEPNRDKAVGPGGQRLTSIGGKSAGRDIEVPGVDKPDGINSIDPTGETKADEDKLL